MRRILYLIRIFVVLLILFIIQKPLFMLFNHEYWDNPSLSDVWGVIKAGIRLDLSTSAYLLLIPLLVCLISLFWEEFRMRKYMRFYYVPIAVLLSVIFISDTVLYSFWGSKLDASELMYVHDPVGMLSSLSLTYTILAIAAVAVVAYIISGNLISRTPSEMPRDGILSSLLFLPVIGLLFLCIRGGISESTANVSYAYHSSKPFLNHSAINPAFNLFHSMMKADDIANQFQFYPEEECRREWADEFKTDTTLSVRLLNTARPNILLIIWEGCGNSFADDANVTPGLQKLKDGGILFTNLHANSFRTDRGILSILSGWMSLPTVSLMKRTDKCQQLPGICSTLAEHGYESTFYYAGDVNFTNMRCYLNETGFSRILGVEDIQTEVSQSQWGYPDEWLNSSPTAEELFQASGQKRMDVILTLSSHEPWDVPFSKFKDEKQNTFAYSDSCIYQFMERFRKSDAWKNTLVVITADHGIPTKAGQPTTDASISEIPMIWTGGAIRKDAPRTIDVLCSQSDIAATLLSQMHIAATDFPLSRNVLGRQYKHPFAHHAPKGAVNYFDKDGVSTYDYAADTELSPDFQNDSTRIHREKSLLQYIYYMTSHIE